MAVNQLVSGYTMGRLISRVHNSRYWRPKGSGIAFRSNRTVEYAFGLLFTILHNQPRCRPRPENLEIGSYSRYIFPTQITCSLEMTWQAKSSCAEHRVRRVRRAIETNPQLAQELVFCNSDLDKSITVCKMGSEGFPRTFLDLESQYTPLRCTPMTYMPIMRYTP